MAPGAVNDSLHNADVVISMTEDAGDDRAAQRRALVREVVAVIKAAKPCFHSGKNGHSAPDGRCRNDGRPPMAPERPHVPPSQVPARDKRI
jgi:hypothetical protein